MKKTNLNSSSLLNKKFDIELSGYSAAQVDEFLDKIIEDYSSYEEGIKSLEASVAEKTHLLNDKDEVIDRMKIEIDNLKEQLEKSGKATNNALLEEIRSLKAEIKKPR